MKTASSNTSFSGSQRGFTLVEIAIVLVIIGLLLGGILKGQEMITQAKIKNVINDLNGISAAMYGYQDRYRALPGDDKSAATRWTSCTPACAAGNGDGVIGGTYTATTGESSQFWLHLRMAGFVSGTGADQPFNAVSGKMGVQTADGTQSTPPVGVLAETGTTNPFTSLMICSANLPDKIAISVDSQMDDGIGNKGTLRGQDQAGTPNPTIAATASAYTETGTNTYVLCKTL